MRFFHVLLLIAIFAFALIFFATSGSGDVPEIEAKKFISLVSNGDTEAALREFGDNTCHCAPEGGYVAYLQYAAAHEPNIAFLIGQKPLNIGAARVVPLPYNGEPYMLPWDRPEDVVVFVPVELRDQTHRPYVVPLDSAFGYEVTESDVQKFGKDPSDWKIAFTLRIRPSLAPGLVKPRGPKEEPTELEKAVKDGLMPKELMKYVHPKDVGTVKLASGQTVALEQFAGVLPRLKSFEVGLKVVRRGKFRRWAVKKLGVGNAVLVLSDGREMKVAMAEKPDEVDTLPSNVHSAASRPGTSVTQSTSLESRAARPRDK